jgi:predicted dehydrogenase
MSGGSGTPPLRIGIVGYGLMGKAHSYGYRVAPMLRRLPVTPVVTVMSGRDPSAVAAAAAAYGVPATVTDWRELIARDDVDVVDICTPPGTHAEIAGEAATAGKAVLCEKPLALSYREAAAALTAVTRAAVRRPCDFTVEVNGSRGTLTFSYARLNELWYGSADDDAGLYGMRRIRAEHPSHPYSAQWWPIGQGVGYGASFANQAADLLEGWPDAPWTPGFREGAAVQAVCEAMETSAVSGRWVTIREVIASTL